MAKRSRKPEQFRGRLLGVSRCWCLSVATRSDRRKHTFTSRNALDSVAALSFSDAPI
jgi:hypothetical protein